MALAAWRVIVTKDFPESKKLCYLVLESKSAEPVLQLEREKVTLILPETFWEISKKYHSNSVVRAAPAKSISPQDFEILGKDGELTGAGLSNTQLSTSSLLLTWSQVKYRYSGSDFTSKYCYFYKDEAESLQLPDPGTNSLELPWYEDFDDAYKVAMFSNVAPETSIGIEKYEAEVFPKKEESALDAMDAGTPFFVGIALAGSAAMSIKDWLWPNKGNN